MGASATSQRCCLAGANTPTPPACAPSSSGTQRGASTWPCCRLPDPSSRCWTDAQTGEPTHLCQVLGQVQVHSTEFLMFRLPESGQRSPARAAVVPPPSDQGCPWDAFPPPHAEGSFTPGCLTPRSSCLPTGPGSSQGQEHPSTALLGGRSGSPPPSRKPSKAKGRRAGQQYTVLQGLCSKRNTRERDRGQRLWTCSNASCGPWPTGLGPHPATLRSLESQT